MLYKKFPELTEDSINRLAKGALREIAKRATLARPVSINGRMMSTQEGLDFYALYMPADPKIQFGKIYKYERSGKKE